jgi:hypothetical protein
MPYIKQEDRERFDKWLKGICPPDTPGELNYILTKICHLYLDRSLASYQYHNDVIGVLECAKQEFYRRMTVPYEDKKIQENGDV